MNNEEAVKQAFEKVKEDIFNLGDELSSLKEEIHALKLSLVSINNKLGSLSLENSHIPSKYEEYPLSTQTPIIPTHIEISTDNPTHNSTFKDLKAPNMGISIRNRGDPTDRQLDSQTDNPTHNSSKNSEKSINEHLFEASEVLASLDNIKKQIRLKFKAVTNQEMLVFSTIYQLEEQDQQPPDYKTIALKLGLSQGSIRDYVQKMLAKGIPILKTKYNNKKICLSISTELRKLATLDTLIRLRSL